MIRVIYKDQSTGMIESHLLEKLIRNGRIIAYHGMEHWISVLPGTTYGESTTAGADRTSAHRRRSTDR